MYNVAFHISILITALSHLAASNLRFPLRRQHRQKQKQLQQRPQQNSVSSHKSKPKQQDHQSEHQPLTNEDSKSSTSINTIININGSDDDDGEDNENHSNANSNINKAEQADKETTIKKTSSYINNNNSSQSTTTTIATTPSTATSTKTDLVSSKSTSGSTSGSTSTSTSSSSSTTGIQNQSKKQQHFIKFQNNYLLVYLLAVAADWIQGPYIYALYSSYGYSNNDIAHLYIAGFASSAIFGTFIASIADKYGRRKSTLIYCISYMLSCMTKHSPNFYVLLLGRILGGISYSILFSAFESWMIYEYYNNKWKFHIQHQNQPNRFKLSIIFAKSQFGNGIIAIVSGLIAQYFSNYFHSKIIPFDLSICILFILFFILYFTWNENYGNSNQSISNTLFKSFHILHSNKHILLLCIIQTCFESSLYTFTFIWTPALQISSSTQQNAIEIPHGTIFATFMACTMIGSNLFTILSINNNFLSTEYLMKYIFIIATFSFICSSISNHPFTIYLSFLVFELLCGIYFPAIATIRAPFIPEENRSSLLTFFRIPLNVIVVIALYEDMSVKNVLTLCAILMAIGVMCMQCLTMLTESKQQNDIINSNNINSKNNCKDMNGMTQKEEWSNGKDENC